MPPRLSVCIIARNEQDNLPRALKSLQGLADEVVVTDTGSMDDTRQVAKRFGARTTSFPWVDDFSAAYNHCLDQATGEWILILDADEELLPESRPRVATAIARPDAFAYFLYRQDLVDIKRPDHFTETLLVRLFRRSPEVRFIGRIHSQFAKPLAQIAAASNQQVLRSDIRLRHYGYLGQLKTEKHKRGIRLLKMELQDRPDQFYYLVELGRAQLAMGDPDGIDALCKAARMVAAGEPAALGSGGALALLLESVLAWGDVPDDFPLSGADARRLALFHFPNSVPLLWQIALDEFKKEHFEDCAVLLEQIVRLGREGTYDPTVSFDPSIMQGSALLNLGVCCVRMARLDDAMSCFQQLLNDPEHGHAAKQNLERIYKIKKEKP